MRWSATRFRWVLLGGVFLLAAVVAGFFGLARYRAGKIWQHILARNGVNLRRESDGVTWSQSSKGRTLFTVHASRATPEGNNKWALHDAVLILYGREKGRDDRIYGKEFEYDQDQGIARALGEVHMDLQAPEPGGKAPAAGARVDLGFNREDTAAADPAVIHVRTSGLVYMRKLGIAATGEATEFRFGGITCTSRGAEFDSEHSLIRLLADVTMSGQLKRAPFLLVATHAELDRSSETADLTAPVLTSEGRGARAAHALFHLHKDGSLQTADANGAVAMHDGLQTISAAQMSAVFAADNHPQHARLSDDVRFSDADQEKPSQGTAKTLDLDWNHAGTLSEVAANGAVNYLARATEANGEPEQRQMHAEQAIASFAPGPAKHALLRRVRLTGGAQVDAMSPSAKGHGDPGSQTETRIRGDELVTEFVTGPAGKALAKALTGTGHTELEQRAGDGARQRSTGETLEMTFSPKVGGNDKTQGSGVSSAVQTGHVEVQSWAVPKAGPAGAAGVAPELTTGRADRAVYAAGESSLTLTGTAGERASVQQPQGEFMADQIVLEQGTGDAEAVGHVAATSLGTNGGPGTHVLASRAHLLHTQSLSEFYGSAREPAQMWQGGSQIHAAQITLDGKTHAVSARPEGVGGRIQAIFATAGARKDGTGKGLTKSGDSSIAKASPAFGRPGGNGLAGDNVPEAERNTLAVSALRLDYDEAHRQAVFGGDVHLTGATGEVTAERGVAFLKQPENKQGAGTAARTLAQGQALAPDMGGSLDRFVMLGNVRLKQPGRTGTGEQLTYSSATDSFALTGSPGSPPRVTGEGGTVVTGATLLFEGADSTIVVAGTKGDAKATGPARVHTETDLKP